MKKIVLTTSYYDYITNCGEGNYTKGLEVLRQQIAECREGSAPITDEAIWRVVEGYIYKDISEIYKALLKNIGYFVVKGHAGTWRGLRDIAPIYPAFITLTDAIQIILAKYRGLEDYALSYEEGNNYLDLTVKHHDATGYLKIYKLNGEAEDKMQKAFEDKGPTPEITEDMCTNLPDEVISAL